MAAKWQEIALDASSVTKERGENFSFFITCQILWASLTVFVCFFLYSHCRGRVIDHTFFQGLAQLPLAKYCIIFSAIVCLELAGGITISPHDSS